MENYYHIKQFDSKQEFDIKLTDYKKYQLLLKYYYSLYK